MFHQAAVHGVLPEGTGQGNNKRDVRNTLVKAAAFMGKPMVAEHFTVIGIENNDGVFPQPHFVQCVNDASVVSVDQFYHPVIGRLVSPHRIVCGMGRTLKEKIFKVIVQSEVGIAVNGVGQIAGKIFLHQVRRRVIRRVRVVAVDR